MTYYSNIFGIDFKQLVEDKKVEYFDETGYGNYCYKHGNLIFNDWRDNGFLTVLLSKKYVKEYEDFICDYLKPGCWNEYVESDKSLLEPTQGNIYFIFKLLNGSIKKYTLDSSNENEILDLVYTLSKVKYKSVRKMLVFNSVYRFYNVIMLEKEDITANFVKESCEKGIYSEFLDPFKDNFNLYQKNVQLISDFDMETNSGGILSYLYGSGKQTVEELLLILKELKLDKIYDLINEALNMLPSDFFENVDIFCDDKMDEISEKISEIDPLIYELCEELNDAVIEYVNNNIDKFCFNEE